MISLVEETVEGGSDVKVLFPNWFLMSVKKAMGQWLGRRCSLEEKADARKGR